MSNDREFHFVCQIKVSSSSSGLPGYPSVRLPIRPFPPLLPRTDGLMLRHARGRVPREECPVPVVRHFQPLRHQSIRPRLGLIVSVSLHMAIVLPFVVPSRHPTQHESLITQMVVFLVPPDRPVGRQETSEGLDWGAAAGNRGAVQQHQADKAAKEKLPEGEEGEEQPVPSAS